MGRLAALTALWLGLLASPASPADQRVAVSVFDFRPNGLTGLRSMLLGSVSNAVVHHADRPTLVIHHSGDDAD